MKGISKKEIEIISWLEFNKKYFFRSADIDQFSKNKTQRYNIIKDLIKKKRIVKLNKTKYYLIPIKAQSGFWGEHPYIIVDEMMNSEKYVIGGWSAANYWNLTEQVPMQVDVYSNKRQGKVKVLNTRIVFHHARSSKIKRGIIKKMQNKTFRILPKGEMRKWMLSKK